MSAGEEWDAANVVKGQKVSLLGVMNRMKTMRRAADASSTL